MKLHYRGLSYEYNRRQVGSKKTQQALTSGHNLTYRGVSYLVEQNSTFNEVPQAPLAYKLSFRGRGYFVNKTA